MIIKVVVSGVGSLPMQTFPSPVKPSLQVQVKSSFVVGVQRALSSQSSKPSAQVLCTVQRQGERRAHVGNRHIRVQ